LANRLAMTRVRSGRFMGTRRERKGRDKGARSLGVVSLHADRVLPSSSGVLYSIVAERILYKPRQSNAVYV
jgi:hypothetical protein